MATAKTPKKGNDSAARQSPDQPAANFEIEGNPTAAVAIGWRRDLSVDRPSSVE